MRLKNYMNPLKKTKFTKLSRRQKHVEELYESTQENPIKTFDENQSILTEISKNQFISMTALVQLFG